MKLGMATCLNKNGVVMRLAFGGWICFMFLVGGTVNSLLMLSLLGSFDFSFAAGVLLFLGGGIVAWLALHFLRWSHSVCCASLMGLGSGIAGAGGMIMLGHLVLDLMPEMGITANSQ